MRRLRVLSKAALAVGVALTIAFAQQAVALAQRTITFNDCDAYGIFEPFDHRSCLAANRGKWNAENVSTADYAQAVDPVTGQTTLPSMHAEEMLRTHGKRIFGSTQYTDEVAMASTDNGALVLSLGLRAP